MLAGVSKKRSNPWHHLYADHISGMNRNEAAIRAGKVLHMHDSDRDVWPCELPKQPDIRSEQIEDPERRLDELDLRLAGIYAERMKLSQQISEEKLLRGDKLFDRQKDQDRLIKMQNTGSNDFARHALQELFSQIYATERKKQYQLLLTKGSFGRLPFVPVDELDKENVRVVFQGVEGAYSHAAMCRYFGDDVNSFHVDKWKEAMEAIADGEADYAVLPIENSTAGIVADNFDLMMDFENYIVAEQVIRCEHVLMGLPGTKTEDIREVYSHPQALMQCSQFLNEHAYIRQVPFSNTALAARKVARDKIPERAAIGSAFAAARYGLEILEEHIYDNEANSTRFIIVSNQRIFRKDATKISICFEVPHRSGALYHILGQFIYNDVNMYRIESRPIADKNWEYRIFVDFEGNLNQSSVKNALMGIRTEAINLKILGNY